MKKWTTVPISCTIMYVTRGEGVQKAKIFADIIDGSPLTKVPGHQAQFCTKVILTSMNSDSTIQSVDQNASKRGASCVIPKSRF